MGTGRSSTAGTSSQRKYDDLTRSWRRRRRTLFVTLALLCLLVVLASFITSRQWPQAGWWLGLLGGVASAFWLIARLSPPGWIENWQAGSRGEKATAKALKPLEEVGWVILHDLPAGRGNIDHIAIGPAGVYLLDSKVLGGIVTVDQHGGVTVQRPDEDLTYQHTGSRHLLRLAQQTHDRVRADTRINLWVTPVMVLWSEFPDCIVESDCTYVHGDELAGWLQSRPQCLAPSRLAQVAQAVTAAWPRT